MAIVFLALILLIFCLIMRHDYKVRVAKYEAQQAERAIREHEMVMNGDERGVYGLSEEWTEDPRKYTVVSTTPSNTVRGRMEQRWDRRWETS